MTTLSEFRKVKTFCKNLFSEPEFREVINGLTEDDDFEVENVRFINENNIDLVQEEELGSDLYLLGCFNANFLSCILGISVDVIISMQESEAYEALGKLIIDLDKLQEVQQEYASVDGYGHHFNSYDSSEEVLNFNGNTYYVFDQH